MFILRWLRSDSHFSNWGVFLFAVATAILSQSLGSIGNYRTTYSQGYLAGQKAEQAATKVTYYLVNKDTCPNTNYCIVEVRK